MITYKTGSIFNSLNKMPDKDYEFYTKLQNLIREFAEVLPLPKLSETLSSAAKNIERILDSQL